MKKRFSDYPPNLPRKLIKALHVAGSARKLEKVLGVNHYYISKLMNEGIEPTNPKIRVKMFLPRKPHKPRTPKRELLPGEKETKKRIALMAKELRNSMKEITS